MMAASQEDDLLQGFGQVCERLIRLPLGFNALDGIGTQRATARSRRPHTLGQSGGDTVSPTGATPQPICSSIPTKFDPSH